MHTIHVHVLFYGLESRPLSKTHIKSLDFVINSAFSKTSCTKSQDIIDNCIGRYLPVSLWLTAYLRGKTSCVNILSLTMFFVNCNIYAALRSRCGHYILQLWLLSFFFLFSSPILSGRKVDVYHTSTHDVALVQIYNAGLKCAARGSLKIQDAKYRHLGTIPRICRAISSQLRHVSTIGKKTC